MNGDSDTRRPPDLVRAIVDFGGNGELLVATPPDITVADPIETRAPGKVGREIDPAAGGIQIRAYLPALGEASVRAEAEEYQCQARVVEVAREFRRTPHERTDHRVGDLDPRIAAVGDCPDQVVRPSRPGRAQHFPSVGLTTELYQWNVHRRVLI